ncbi:MAG: dTDP-4-dehydrorhamnose reductase [Weeksellaceae bacterium]|nr:dTDP-4-dehydrorhamnose reductase [Weeksellaceae bacterium]
MKKVVVTGADGQLAKCLAELTQSRPTAGIEFIYLNRQQLDISDKNVVEAFFFSNQIDYLVNCAAYTAVDLAETEVEKAFQVNADGVRNLAEECYENQVKFIHISTDYVFDGHAQQAMDEQHTCNPLSVYGKSKLEGERLALQYHAQSIILRTAWVYSEYGKNFLNTMLRLFAEKDQLNIVHDQHGTPTSAHDLAMAIYLIIQAGQPLSGIYHMVNSGDTTWHGFAEEIKRQIGSHIQLNPISTSQYPTPAHRPAYSVLSNEKLAQTLNWQIPHWQTSLQHILQKTGQYNPTA